MGMHRKSGFLCSAGLLTLGVLALGGCESAMNPSFMPTGYTYHRDTYKSAPGPEVVKPAGHNGDVAADAGGAGAVSGAPQPFGGTYKEGLKTSYYDPTQPSPDAGQ